MWLPSWTASFRHHLTIITFIRCLLRTMVSFGYFKIGWPWILALISKLFFLDFLSEHNRNQQKTRKDHHERHQNHSHSKSHSRVVSPSGSSCSKMLKPEAKFHLLSPESNRSRSHSSTMDSTSNALYVMESPVNKSSNISLDSQSSRKFVFKFWICLI